MPTFKLKNIMAISSNIKIAALVLALVVGSNLVLPEYSFAFDPRKVFKEEKPSTRKILRHYFKKKKRGEVKEAHDILKYAAQQGNPAAQWKLGRMYERGDGVKKNALEAFSFYKMIADRYGEARPGRPEWRITGKAMVALGHYYTIGIPEAGISPNAEEAMVMYTTSAMYFSDPDAQFELGKLMLGEGAGPEQNRQGIRMLNLSRKKGHAGSQALLGHALVEGEFILQNVVRGLVMLTRAERRATHDIRGWVQDLQQQAFALATVDQRRAAISKIQQ